MSAQHRNQTKDVKENMLKGLIIVDIEQVAVKHHRVWMDEVDRNSQYLETYDAMRKTTESEREAKDPITEQINKYTRNGGRRDQEPSEISTEPKAEISSVKVHQTKAIRWNQNQTPDAREGASSQRRARSAGAFPGVQQGERKDNDELMEFAARFNRLDAAVQLATGHKISGEAKNAEAAKSGLARHHDDAWGTLLTW